MIAADIPGLPTERAIRLWRCRPCPTTIWQAKSGAHRWIHTATSRSPLGSTDRAFDLPASDQNDLFVDDDGSVFEAQIDRLAASGITLGCNPPANDRFCPNDPVTRGQMAAFIRRSLGF